MDNKISVIIPCYNQGYFLNESVGSVLAQTHINWECIIVNDGSVDNTKEIALSFTEKDSRIKYIQKGNGGLSSARNAGLEIATGNFIQFLDADDTLEPGKFERQLEIVNKTKSAENVVLYSNFVYGKAVNIRESVGRTMNVVFKSSEHLQELIARWENDLVIPCHSFLFSCDFFSMDRIRFDESLPNHEDFDCWLAIFSKNPNVLFTDEILCRYRLSGNSMSQNMKLMGEGFLKVLNKHLKVLAYSSHEKSLLGAKKLAILQAYKRFDLMNWKEKIMSRKILRDYYASRIVDKLTFKN